MLLDTPANMGVVRMPLDLPCVSVYLLPEYKDVVPMSINKNKKEYFLSGCFHVSSEFRRRAI